MNEGTNDPSKDSKDSQQRGREETKKNDIPEMGHVCQSA